MRNANGTEKTELLRVRRDRSANLWQREAVLEELDYVDTPPSPIRMWLILFFCGLFCFAVGASIITQIDTYAIAQARVQPPRGTAVVQTLVGGRVTAIRVSDGDHVHKGDLLLQLDAPGDGGLVAPIDGTVQDSILTRIGQIVNPGQTVLAIFPDDAASEVIGVVSTRDIASVKTGQRAVLKLDALPVAQYGTLTGTVVRIYRRAIEIQPTPESGEESHANRGALLPEAHFTVAVELDPEPSGRKSVPLMPGMTGRLEILTDRRRAIEYFLSPILEVAHHEG